MPIAKPIPIDDIGETINIEKIIAINIVMIIGCVLVNPLITSPKPNVINLVYGKINSPIKPATAPPTIGNTIIFKLPNL